MNTILAMIMRWRGLVVAAIIAVICLYLVSVLEESHSARAICVKVGSQINAGGNYLPAVDGYVTGPGTSGGSNGTNHWDVESSYKVVASVPGHFFVIAHYQIDHNGVSSQADCALPVYDKAPAPSERTPIDGDLFAYAYLTNTTLNY